ncbi:glycosyltransferase family 4 protein [Roseococcus sp. DSY-14]|uniref:glycosyltransferase family 4 protein n=1 Tax=Roseococcus sp. DSY-14 TaxID=3369650 RepID=UPI00387B598E
MRGALSLSVLREMRGRGFDVTLAYFFPEAVGYTWDPCEDFAQEGRLLDLSADRAPPAVQRLAGAIAERRIPLAVQFGAPQAYGHVGRLKERRPGLRTLDVLYNEVGHTVAHFLHENAFDGVVVESEAMRAFVARETAKAEPGIHVMLSGVDLDAFRPARDQPPRPLTLGYVGRMSPEKDPLRFVALAEALHRKLPELRFAMYGEGAMEGEVRARIAGGSAAAVIEYRGYVDHVREALHAVDAVMLPSRVDGRPNVVMEANACGVPVFGAPVGGIPELIEDGANGWLLRPDAAGHAAGVIASWLAAPAALEETRLRCRRIAEERFDRSRMLDDYERLFDAQCEAGRVA